jgi:dipeptidyl aminopeptidase/acylaminoacyl peptidase
MFNIVIPLRGEDGKMSGQRLEGEKLHKPTITDMISLEVPNINVQPRASPDGRRIAYAVRAANWNKNHYASFCHVYDARLGRSFQLTRSGNVKQMRWIDCDTLALLKEDLSGEEANPQVWLFENLVGEGLQITDHESGVQSFEPFGGGILFLAEDPERKKRKVRSEEFGSFTHFEQEESASALYYVNVQKMKSYKDMSKRKTEDEAKKLVKPVVELSKRFGEPLKIVGFVCSPLYDAVYMNCRSKDYLVYNEETSVYRLSLEPDDVLEEFMERERTKKNEGESRSEGGKGAPEDSAEDYFYLGELTRLSLPKGASIASVSPDGNKLLVRHKDRDNMSYTLSELWILDLRQVEDLLEEGDLGGHLIKITQGLDREPSTVRWLESGVYVGYIDGTKTRIAELTESSEMMVLDLKGISPMFSFHMSSGGFIAFIGSNNESFWEVYASNTPLSSPDWELNQLTSFGKGIEGWDLGTVETVRWISRDGAEIEGVLRKPTDFDPDKIYPLVFVVHGGPRWFNGEFLLEGSDLTYYPVVQFVNKGVLVLKPNYRGSIGRGQAFTELNKDNLGVGDLWDLESAIDHLDSQGLIDGSRVGCMGWSQGGYISAFAGMRSKRFSAVSVGAGIADWYTYHITNDIPQFTTHYLSGSPFDSRDLYIKTAPISGLREAGTPMLIQHGAKDQRVPLASATELYRGLKQMKIPVELFVYLEMAHPITKPRENRAIMHQNLTWFSHHLLGEELNFRINATKKTNNTTSSKYKMS